MALSKCLSSQLIIHVEANRFAYQHDVSISFHRSGADQKPVALSKNSNNHFKGLCRRIIEGLPEFRNHQFCYDGCAILWRPKPINMRREIPHADLDGYMKSQLDDPLGFVHVTIGVNENGMIKMDDFADAVDGSTMTEDRSWRSLMELLLAEDPLTRGRFVQHGSGCLIEVEERHFQRGLVFRNGSYKGVQIINGANGTGPQMALAMDCCKKVFFPGNANFLGFLRAFGGDYGEAEKLCQGLRLRLISDPRRILRFRHFDHNGNATSATMEYAKGETFALADLEIIPDQSVAIDAMQGDLKDKALSMNVFKANERMKNIMEQCRKLQLNNPITQAFGIRIEEKLLQGDFKTLPPMNIRLSNNVTVKPDDQGGFKMDSRNYFKRGNLKNVILLATKEDKAHSYCDVEKIIQRATNKPDAIAASMLHWIEFDTTSQTPRPWVEMMAKIARDFPGPSTLVVTVDEIENSHPFLKLGEAISGVKTQHLKLSTVEGVRYQTMNNINHKINIKMGGLNHMVEFGKKVTNLNLSNGNVFAIGLDVCHPRGYTEEPSFVGIVTNPLKNPQEFIGEIFAQEPRKELIDDAKQIYGKFINNETLKNRVKHALQKAKSNGRQINTIAVIRDGISEGQYGKCLSVEVQAIRDAAAAVDIKAKIAVFIVTKRGNVRHFHPDANVVNSMPPRSFITFGTRHKFAQFYMTAHKSLIGTAKSIMITKLADEVGIALEEAEEFLLGLTYLHQIVASPISIPTPVAQADAIAQRGQQLFKIIMKHRPEKIPRGPDGMIQYNALSDMLNINNAEMPDSRYTA